MSIYRKVNHGTLSELDPRFTGAPRSKPDSTLEAEWEAVERKKRSRAEPTSIALPRTLAWADTLPVEVQPTTLILRYGRIANLLALDWNDARAIAADFDQLLIDRRGNRKGFPPIILSELRARAQHYRGDPSSQTTASHSPWYSARKR